uniref:Uncharacterized protein n=1 Tax=Anguilla anguilla TaxID=7936 RepID=A0A0E9SIJ7_ANGAN
MLSTASYRKVRTRPVVEVRGNHHKATATHLISYLKALAIAVKKQTQKGQENCKSRRSDEKAVSDVEQRQCYDHGEQWKTVWNCPDWTVLNPPFCKLMRTPYRCSLCLPR